mgnify:CR=1 FL=1
MDKNHVCVLRRACNNVCNVCGCNDSSGGRMFRSKGDEFWCWTIRAWRSWGGKISKELELEYTLFKNRKKNQFSRGKEIKVKLHPFWNDYTLIYDTYDLLSLEILYYINISVCMQVKSPDNNDPASFARIRAKVKLTLQEIRADLCCYQGLCVSRSRLGCFSLSSLLSKYETTGIWSCSSVELVI